LKIKCILKKGDWVDDNVECDIEIHKNYRGLKTAYGSIKTSKSLPIKDAFSYFVSGEIFELWFENVIESADGLKIMLENIAKETKRSAEFKSMGPLFKKDKK